MVNFVVVLVLACVLAVNANESEVAAVFDMRLNYLNTSQLEVYDVLKAYRAYSLSQQ